MECPSRGELVDYIFGEVDSCHELLIGEHLEYCARCQKLADNMCPESMDVYEFVMMKFQGSRIPRLH